MFTYSYFFLLYLKKKLTKQIEKNPKLFGSNSKIFFNSLKFNYNKSKEFENFQFKQNYNMKTHIYIFIYSYLLILLIFFSLSLFFSRAEFACTQPNRNEQTRPFRDYCVIVIIFVVVFVIYYIFFLLTILIH